MDGCRVCGGQADGVCHPQRKNCTSGDRRSAAARAGGNQNAENACRLPFGSAVGRSAANRGVYSGDPGVFLAVGLPNGSDADFRSLRNISAFLRTADCDGIFLRGVQEDRTGFIYLLSVSWKKT